MQENYKDFDLGLRSMLLDAEEKAPSGIWDAVSSRLDAIDAAAAPVAAGRSRRVWAWSAAALATAASLVGGIFLFRNAGTGDFTASGNYVSEFIVPNAPADVPAPESVPVEPEKASVAPESHSRPVSEAPSVRVVPAEASPSGSEAETIADPDSAVLADIPASPAEPASPSSSVSSAPATSPASSAVTDPFALMAFEDAKAASRLRVSSLFGGGVSSNKAAVRGGAYGVSGHSVQHRITEKSSSSYGIPISFGLGARLHFNDRWSVGSGLDYSMLTRTFDAVYTDRDNVSSTSEIRHTMHYIGIPLDVFYTILNTNDISFYVNAGGEAEYGIANNYKVKHLGITESDKVHGIQWSAGMGLGIEFKLSDVTNLFVEPRLKYYFNCDQPKSVRTEKPLQLLFRAGLRFDL